MATHGMERLEALHVEKIVKRLRDFQSYIWTPREPVMAASIAETMEHLSLDAAKRLRYSPFAKARAWGRAWSTAWFRIECVIPRAWRGLAVSLLFESEGECIAFRDGEPVQGFDVNRRDYVLTPRATGGERIELYVEAGANAAYGNFQRRVAQVPELAVFNPGVWDMCQSIAALLDMVNPKPLNRWGQPDTNPLDRNDTNRARIIFELDRAVDAFDHRDTTRAGLDASARRVDRLLAPSYARTARTSAQTIACMGHAHIDVAWLWPLRETVRKCGRSFSNVLSLMDRYPDFVFCQSQPHLYEFAKERYPSLYRRIRQKVRAGQWIPAGCMWVEPDCNVTGSESLVRQILFGTRFFEREFGRRATELWLPDVFGYSAALPQLLRRSGIRNFLTQKISWSQFTTFPYHSFHWEGIDGSRVLTHFPPAGTYNSSLLACEMLKAERDYREKDRSPIQAVPFGYGDGGGGPTKEQIERMRRYANLDGMPKLAPMSPETFFKQLEKEGASLPEWIGELYLELHRGTLTTQARTKRNNRECEILLRDAEFAASLAHTDGVPYAADALNAAWKTVLLNQFHDIIPGSSIGAVYREADTQYAAVRAATGTVRDSAIAAYAKTVDTRGDGQPVLLVNSLGWERTGTVTLSAKGLRVRRNPVAVGPDGVTQPVCRSADGLFRFQATVPSMGHAVYHLRHGAMPAPAVKATKRLLENECLRVRFGRDGRLRSIYDKMNAREVLAPGGMANAGVLFADRRG